MGPAGKPIPAGDGGQSVVERRLSELAVGEKGRVVRADIGSAAHSFLAEEGLDEGVVVTLLAVGDDHACLVESEIGQAHLAPALADAIVVSPLK